MDPHPEFVNFFTEELRNLPPAERNEFLETLKNDPESLRHLLHRILPAKIRTFNKGRENPYEPVMVFIIDILISELPPLFSREMRNL